MKYQFHPEALIEFEAAADFYREREKGLELRFLESVYSTILNACEAPERWRIFDGEIRRVLVRTFPYAILYSNEDEFIYIVAVMHCSREPGYWRYRSK